MPEVEDVLAEDRIQERGLSICEGDEEPLTLRVVLNDHRASAGVLLEDSRSAATWRRAILPHTSRLVAGAKRLGVPVILYVNGAAHLLQAMAGAGADVIGIDWRVPASEAIRHVGARAALQGNLDPSVLFAPPDVVERETNRVLDEFARQEGYVFNLGSGILPGTPVESMEAVFRAVKARRMHAG